MKAITVSVDYGDLLGITLPRNSHHFEKILVVTTPDDRETQRVCSQVPNCEVYTTDAFYRGDGAIFRKWLALEEGLDRLGRTGWIWVLDADILLPRIVSQEFEIGCLYSPYRRMLADPRQYRDSLDWSNLPRARDREWAGYSQIFHCDDPHLGSPPWYETNWRHAGGADSFFQMKWPGKRKLRPRFEVLHLGVHGRNWCGRTTPRLDGTLPKGAESRRWLLRGLIRRRGRGIGRFHHEKMED